MSPTWPPGWIVATWPGNPRVRGLFTGRAGGCSEGPYGGGGGGGMNLGAHVGDDPRAVAANRELLGRMLDGARPFWLEQVHGCDVVDLDAAAGAGDGVPRADASLSTRAGVVASVLVADCLPVLLAAPDGRGVAAAHAGWRGLCAGVLERSATALAARCGCDTGHLQAWLGPAIGPARFEVGDEVREAFTAHGDVAAQAFVRGERPGKWMADLFALARMRLRRAGLAPDSILGGGVCTVSHPSLYYSFRRDRVTGRQAGLVWLA
jgi:YfiH family protein